MVRAAGQTLGNRTSPCLREPHFLAGGVPGTYSGPPPSTARLPPAPEDADLFLEPQKQWRRRAGALPPPGGMPCKGALQGASWRHDQKPRGCWARRPRPPKGRCAALRSGPKEADADGKCLPWRQVLPWTPAGAFQGSPRPCHFTRTF